MKKIIIVEDDPIVGRLYRSQLEKQGFDVEVATDGRAGFEQLQRLRPDGILLDLMLPKLNGIDFLKKLRSGGDFARLPVMVFTNAGVPSMIQLAQEAGATQIFDKSTSSPQQIIDAFNRAWH